jgi:uncharacterized protein HemX
MEVRKDQFPVVIQAYEITGTKEVFIAEQIVNSQAEINVFSTRYTGKLIKARQLTSAEAGQNKTVNKTSKSSTGTILLVIVVILVILFAVGLYTGWIQQNFGIGR